MNVFSFLYGIWQAMFELFWFSKKSLTNKFSVYIKSNTGSTLSVNIDPKWDIKNVKEVIAPKLGMTPEEVKIILAGKELDDSIIIEECDLGDKSILHAVKSISPGKTRSKPLNESTPNIAEAQEDRPEAMARFYVWCNSPCLGMHVGKLRVRCAQCKSGAITVDTDPASWKDVLEPHRISGHCEQLDCPAGAVSWSEFYMKCTSHQSGGETDHAVPLHLVKSNYNSVPCLACTDIKDPVVVFACSHVTCIDCFVDYCTSRLRDRQFSSDPVLGYTLACPAHCPDSLVDEPHHFKLLPPNLYSQYQRFGAEEFVLGAGGVLCPQPGCGAGILPDSDCLNKITCINGCGFVFCRHCLQGYHLGECESTEEPSSSSSGFTVNPDRAAQARWDEATKVAIRVTTKPCPKCRTPTERAGGCMHMVCTRCCLEWCWVCQTEWTRDCMGQHWFG